MVMTANPDNTLRPYRVLRAMWFLGRVCAVGDVLQLPRTTAAELQAAGKVLPAPEALVPEPTTTTATATATAQAPAAAPAAEPAVRRPARGKAPRVDEGTA